MEDSGTSRLQGAFRNYLDSRDSRNEYVSENTQKYERFVYILKTIIFHTSGIIGYILVVIYSKWYANFFINLACYFMIWLCLFFLFFHKYICQGRSIISLLKQISCPWRCLTVSADDRDIQTEDHIACQSAAQNNASGEQTASLISQHDLNVEMIANQPTVPYQRLEEQAAMFAFRKYLPSGNIFRIFCCPRNCYPTVSTEDIGGRTEEFAAQHEASEQTVNRFDSILEHGFIEPATWQARSEEAFANLQIVEQRLLRYLLNKTEEREQPSNE